METERNLNPNITFNDVGKSTEQMLLIPTEIAERMKLSGPREVNTLLSVSGYQHKVHNQWVLTEKGELFAVLLDTDKRHPDGTIIQKIKWKETILPKLKEMITIIRRM